MRTALILPAMLLLGLAACDQTQSSRRDGTPGNPPSTATQRAYDRAAGNPPTPPDATPGNPSGTAAERMYDRATGSNTSGAYPQNSSGRRQ